MPAYAEKDADILIEKLRFIGAIARSVANSQVVDRRVLLQHDTRYGDRLLPNRVNGTAPEPCGNEMTYLNHLLRVALTERDVQFLLNGGS